MQNNILNLRPINYFTLKEELCFFMGGRVAADRPEDRDGIIDEIVNADCVTVCNHIVRDDRNYYVFMTANYKFNAIRSGDNNFSITSIFSGREFQAQKKYLYNHGTFLIVAEGRTAIVADGYKNTLNEETSEDWGMPPEVLTELCDGIDAYFFSTERSEELKVDNKFAREIIQPIKNFTKYEDQVEQLDAYKDNYVNYDYCEFVKGKAKKKTYKFFSSSFDPDSELYCSESRVAIETNEEINEDFRRKIKGIIIDRIDEENGTSFIVEFIEQFDDSILVKNNGHMFLQINDVQKRVRERVIQSIENGTVDSGYMYKLFGRKGHPSAEEDEAPGWDEFKAELLSKEQKPNTSQMLAIERGIKTKDIQLVLGPPGTGKTTVIVNWVKYFVKHGKRVLVSSQNNSAVDNVLERVGRDENARIIRIGNIDKIQDNCKQYAPEQQVGKTAEDYIEKLKMSQSGILKDMSGIKETLAYVESVYDDYKLFADCRQTTWDSALVQKEKLKQLSDLHNEKCNALINYRRIYELRIRKDIAYFALKKKTGFLSFLLKPIIFLLDKTTKYLNKKLKEKADRYIESIKEYNRSADEFKALITDAKYVSAKKTYGEILQKCSGYKFDMKNEGPFPIEPLSADYLLSDNVDPVTEIDNYRRKLTDIYARLVIVKKTLDDWGKSIETHRTEIVTDLLVENSNVVGATCIGINTRPKFRKLNFDVSIIDESGQIQIHNAIVPMTRAPKTLMLGDHLQIPPAANDAVVKLCRDNEVPEKQIELLNKSFFEYLFTRFEKEDENTPNLTRLDEQFRMPGNISDVISDWFYKGNYHAHYDMGRWNPIISGTTTPLITISTSREKNRFETAEQGGGYSNDLEAKMAAKIVASLAGSAFKADKSGVSTPQIGIISAYGKQVRLIRQKITEENLGFSPDQVYSIAASLDSFQGQERPLIIYSCTRSADAKRVPPSRARVGFLKELRRLNVAFTRCQIQLVIIGDFDYLTTCEYEKIDEETGEPVPNQSEKKYSEFMTKVLDQAKSDKGEFYYADEFYERTGISNV